MNDSLNKKSEVGFRGNIDGRETMDIPIFKIPDALKDVNIDNDIDIYEPISCNDINRDEKVEGEAKTIIENIDENILDNDMLDSGILDDDADEEQFLENIEGESYYSTYDERLKQTPTNNGNWDGERGESMFHSYDESVNKILEKFGVDGISYKDAIPDFSEVSKGTVEIESMTDNRQRNFAQANEILAEEKGCTPQEVEKWMKDNKFTWHEDNDMKTMLKIPSEINSKFPHLGGVSECKKAYESEWEDEFDE